MGIPLSSIPHKVRLCGYGGDQSSIEYREGHRPDKHRRVATIDAIKGRYYSMSSPLPRVTGKLPSVVTNEASDPSLWRGRKVTNREASACYSLTEYMREAADDMADAQLASCLSTTSPLSTLTQYYASVVNLFYAHLEKAPKVGGAPFKFDQLCNADLSFNGKLPKKGDLYIAVVYVGYGSVVKPLSSILPAAKIVTFDIQCKFNPTIQGDYRKFGWYPFIERCGAPAAVIFMPPCSPRSRQHKRGAHYDGEQQPTSLDAVNADQCVDKAIHDIRVISKYNPQLQWLIENPHYTKFTGLASVQPISEAGKFAIIQYKDYDVAFTVKRTICLHNMLFWKPRPLSSRRNHRGVRWNSAAGWNEQRRWAWPEQQVSEIRSGPMINVMTKAMRAKAKEVSAKAAAIATAASMQADKILETSKADPSDMEVEDTPQDIVEGNSSEDSLMTYSHITQDNVLSESNIREIQTRHETIQMWVEVAKLKSKMEKMRKMHDQQEEEEGAVTTTMVRESQANHHAALHSLRKDTRGYVNHMYINEIGILVIANANQEDPIPVISRALGEWMIMLGHGQITTLHMGNRKLHSWLIERCWWFGMHTDITHHCKHCLVCQRMKFRRVPAMVINNSDGGMALERWYA